MSGLRTPDACATKSLASSRGEGALLDVGQFRIYPPKLCGSGRT